MTQTHKLVPIEPTELQVRAGQLGITTTWAISVYKAMVSHALDVSSEPVAWLKEWVSEGETRRRVDLHNNIESWMLVYSCESTPLYTAPQPSRTADLEERCKRLEDDKRMLLEALKDVTNGSFGDPKFRAEALIKDMESV